MLNKNKSEIVKIATDALCQIYPEATQAQLVHALVIKEKEATLSARPWVNATRPDQKVFDNFFVLGDWTKTNLPATIESAAVSARLMSRCLLN